MSNNKDCPDTIKVKLNIEETLPNFIGIQGCQGKQGSVGYKGQVGPQGPIGPQGPQSVGPQGGSGPQGPTGPVGVSGSEGITGPQGSSGGARYWWLSGGDRGTCIPFVPSGLTGNTGLKGINQPPNNRSPIGGDLLLNLATCEICEYSEATNEFESTNLTMGDCLDCPDQLSECLKNIKTRPDQCTFTLSLSDCPPLFGGFGKPEAHRIKSITIFGIAQTVPPPSTTFLTPDKLGTILEMLDWTYTSAYSTFIYLTSMIIPTDIDQETTLSEIVFEGVESGEIITRTINHQCEGEVCYACDLFNKPQAQRYILSMLPDSLPITSTGTTGSGSTPPAPLIPGLAWIAPECLAVTGLTGAQGLTGMQGLDGQIGPQGTIGLTGATGPTLEEICECLVDGLEDKLPLTNCLYQGLVNQACISFINNLPVAPDPFGKKFYIGTGYLPDSIPISTIPNLPFEFVLGPADFTSQTELTILLAALSAVISGNLVQVKDSPDEITHLVFLDMNENLVHAICLDPSDCCPQIHIPKTTPILTQTNIADNLQQATCTAQADSPTGPTSMPCPTGILDCSTGLTGLAMIPAECVLKPDFDLPTEICSLPPLAKWKCCVEIDASEPFVELNFPKTDNPNGNFPWRVNEMILFGVNLTESYNSLDINNYSDWVMLLELNGWTRKSSEQLTIYQYCLSFNEPQDDSVIKHSYKFMDVNRSLIYCKPKIGPATCVPTDMKNIQIIIKDNGFTGLTGYNGCIGLTGLPTGIEGSTGYEIINSTGSTASTGADICDVKLASPSKILDAVPPCKDVCYICTTTINTTSLISGLNILASPWKILQLVLSGNSQSVPATQFTGALQLQTILTNAGWIVDPEDSDIYTQTIIQPLPQFTSYIIIGNNANKILNVKLNTQCIADCRNLTSSTRYIFTRLDEGQFCWMHPNCFNDPLLNIECCPDVLSLNNIEPCPIVAKYDLRLEINQATISLIQGNFRSINGPFWIPGYKVRIMNPDWDPANPLGPESKYLHKIVEIDSPPNIPTPFNLRNLTGVLQGLGWTPDIEPEDITDSTKKVELVLNNSLEVIIGVCINLFGETGINPKHGDRVNYVITIHTIDRVECHDLPKNAKLLLKNGVIPGFVAPTGPTACLPCPDPTGADATGCTGLCLVDIDCVVPTAPAPQDLEEELLKLSDCADCCTGLAGAFGSTGGLTGCNVCYGADIEFEGESGLPGLGTGFTGICELQPYYQNCIKLSQCDIDLLISRFGDSANLQVVQYHTVGGKICSLNPKKDIGVNPTLQELAQALIELGWVTSDDIMMDDPIELTFLTCLNINYVAINVEGADLTNPVSPFSYMIGANCIILNFCPSTDRANQLLIRKPTTNTTNNPPDSDDIPSDSPCCNVCWTQVCQLPGPIGNQGQAGTQGEKGVTGVEGGGGSTGPAGPLGPPGETGPPGDQEGAIGRTGVLGAIGLGPQGEEGPRGHQGFPGEPAPMGTPPGPTGAQGATGFDGPAGPSGPMGAPNFEAGSPGPDNPTVGELGPTGAQGATGPIDGVAFGQNCGPQGPEFADVFKDTIFVMGPQDTTLFRFRTLVEGDNITFTKQTNEIDIMVSEDFDWSATQFQGGAATNGDAAEVDNNTSLTFQNGSILYVNRIEDNPADPGITIDTTSGAGVNVLEGGMQFQNDVFNTTLGPTVRPTFLEFFQFGSWTTDWQFNTLPGATPIAGSTTEIHWQRVGNVVTLFIPEITSTPSSHATGGSALVGPVIGPPEIIRTSLAQLFHCSFDSSAAGTGPFVKSMIRFAGSAIEISSNTDLSGSAGFSSAEFFSSNKPRAYTYQVTAASGDYCPPFV